MMIEKNIYFRLTKQGCEKGIEILYDKSQVFWSCRKGDDLSNFDALLEHFIPNINLEAVTGAIARSWESELYRTLLKHKLPDIRAKAFAVFCTQIESENSNKPENDSKSKPHQSLNTRIEKAISEETGFIKKDYKVPKLRQVSTDAKGLLPRSSRHPPIDCKIALYYM